MRIFRLLGLSSALLLAAVACSNAAKTTSASSQEVAPVVELTANFCADSAYAYIEQQVAFGPRVPNSEAHIACGNYLSSKLRSFGAEVIEQKADLKAYNGDILKARNIIASFLPQKNKRILLFAHWDTRPYADWDSNPENHNKAIDGANDGGSGVGVLLEIARQLSLKQPEIGVDIILFDAEDYGVPQYLDKNEESMDNSWALGSQYWGRNPHKANYTAEFGILLDMVGGIDAVFPRELISLHYAPQIVDKVWGKATQLGYGKYFQQKRGGVITDDHLYVNQFTKIPSIDIIDYNPMREKSFPDSWHTMNDNMQNISRESLKAVGQTVLEVLYATK